MISHRSLIALLFVTSVYGAAFVPSHKRGGVGASSSLNMKFLKDLGFEKPDWLPDFGKKEETPPAAEEETPAEEDAEPVEAAAEE